MGEASKLALYGVADYTWNIAAYNPIDNWERGLGELMSVPSGVGRDIRYSFLRYGDRLSPMNRGKPRLSESVIGI